MLVSDRGIRSRARWENWGYEVWFEGVCEGELCGVLNGCWMIGVHQCTKLESTKVKLHCNGNTDGQVEERLSCWEPEGFAEYDIPFAQLYGLPAYLSSKKSPPCTST